MIARDVRNNLILPPSEQRPFKHKLRRGSASYHSLLNLYFVTCTLPWPTWGTRSLSIGQRLEKVVCWQARQKPSNNQEEFFCKLIFCIKNINLIFKWLHFCFLLLSRHQFHPGIHYRGWILSSSSPKEEVRFIPPILDLPVSVTLHRWKLVHQVRPKPTRNKRGILL